MSTSSRVLACVLCQQRKVKCDRKFPCANCVKNCVECVPAARAARQRRRRFPERELLDRLRHYEDLLVQNNIEFEPLHAPVVEKTCPGEDGKYFESPEDEHSEGPATETNRPSGVNQKPRDTEDDDDDVGFPHDHVREAEVKNAWDQLYGSNDNLLFGSRKTNVHLSTFHPEQVHIFRLWHIYLENVNPLLKVTHTPTLQARIIDAASNVANISPTLEALMFSVYYASASSLAEDECRTLFGSPREQLVRSYQFACEQALLNCDVLRTSDRECLTALYLYLVSARPHTDPRSLSCLLGVAIRIAQRIGIHNESNHDKCTAFEAEIRRRLWWSIVIFDSRICEMTHVRTAMLAPAWDCRTPLNLNDSDIRPEMRTLPAIHEPTEALFVVVRSKLGEFVRQSAFHSNSIDSHLESIAKDADHGSVPEDGYMVAIEQTLENEYFKFCNLENPLHFMTIWTARSFLAKSRLLDHYSRHPKSSMLQTDAQRDAAVSHALRMLECDTKIMASTLTKGYLWFVHIHFPFLAYTHILQTLRKRPVEPYAEKSWEVMSDNFEVRFMCTVQDDNPLFQLFSRIVLHSWEAREQAFRYLGKPLEVPRIVQNVKQKVLLIASMTKNKIMEPASGAVNIDDLSMPMEMDFGSHGLPYMPDQAMMDVGVNELDWTAMKWNQLDWTAIDWTPMNARG
ncbi:hypothetical protein K505DRAFT_294967 [Melanomma pulvis-pyrius CBS 109.77]|uniref:Zn(2)-C6 fungal-type domain-containing protein n=1 Tax=Melanomma pulvis-pyrius CBS 109.77 TaxID=1314802 RepID=A0A6A6XRV1_9PLEO|nr:hypothetical protein K505DRAFT_294967 [Melanomma pulvis-pyrius CBS 109.77]